MLSKTTLEAKNVEMINSAKKKLLSLPFIEYQALIAENLEKIVFALLRHAHQTQDPFQRNRYLEAISKVINKNPSIIAAQDENGNSCLHMTLALPSLNLTGSLDEKQTPFELSAYTEQFKLINLIIKNQASAWKIRNKQSQSAIRYALVQHSTPAFDILRMLFEKLLNSLQQAYNFYTSDMIILTQELLKKDYQFKLFHLNYIVANIIYDSYVNKVNQDWLIIAMDILIKYPVGMLQSFKTVKGNAAHWAIGMQPPNLNLITLLQQHKSLFLQLNGNTKTPIELAFEIDRKSGVYAITQHTLENNPEFFKFYLSDKPKKFDFIFKNHKRLIADCKAMSVAVDLMDGQCDLMEANSRINNAKIKPASQAYEDIRQKHVAFLIRLFRPVNQHKPKLYEIFSDYLTQRCERFATEVLKLVSLKMHALNKRSESYNSNPILKTNILDRHKFQQFCEQYYTFNFDYFLNLAIAGYKGSNAPEEIMFFCLDYAAEYQNKNHPYINLAAHIFKKNQHLARFTAFGGNSPLHFALAIQPANIQLIDTIFQAYPERLHIGNQHGHSPLEFALSYWRSVEYDLIVFLLKYVKLNKFVTGDKCTIVLFLIKLNYAFNAKFLASITTELIYLSYAHSTDKEYALKCAATAAALIKAYPVMLVRYYVDSPGPAMHCAVATVPPNLELIQALLAQPNRLEYQNEDNQTAMDLAIEADKTAGDYAITRLILKIQPKYILTLLADDLAKASFIVKNRIRLIQDPSAMKIAIAVIQNEVSLIKGSQFIQVFSSAELKNLTLNILMQLSQRATELVKLLRRGEVNHHYYDQCENYLLTECCGYESKVLQLTLLRIHELSALIKPYRGNPILDRCLPDLSKFKDFCALFYRNQVDIKTPDNKFIGRSEVDSLDIKAFPSLEKKF